jgi:hypothetical protein
LPVIFVGTSFGDSDTFLTPLGTMYGVDVHAAAFMSLLLPTRHNELLAFLLDVVLGLAMGGLIAWSWRMYFSLRFSHSAFDRQAAPWMIMAITLGLLVLLAGLTLLSYVLMLYCNVWLSPIPIALGMLFESFFNSAVSAAVGEGYEQRQAVIQRLQAAHANGPETFAHQVEREVEQRPHQAHSLEERAARFFYRDFRRLRKTRQDYALTLLVIRRVAFCALLAWLLWPLL